MDRKNLSKIAIFLSSKFSHDLEVMGFVKIIGINPAHIVFTGVAKNTIWQLLDYIVRTNSCIDNLNEVLTTMGFDLYEDSK